MLSVAVYRVRKNGERDQKPLKIIEVENFDDAERVFWEQWGWKYPENWTLEYEDMAQHDPLYQMLLSAQ